MFSGHRLAGCLTLVLGLAMIVVQNKAISPNKMEHNDEFDSELGSLLDNDSEMSKLLSQYLDKVPISHRTQKHAQRCLGLKFNFHTSSQTSKVSTNTTKYHKSPIKLVLANIFKNHRPKKSDAICKKCRPCPNIKVPCLVCPKDDCTEKCAPCPLPNYCLPPPKPGDCPPKPICPECPTSVVSDQTGFTSSKNVSQTTIRETSAPTPVPKNSSSSSNSSSPSGNSTRHVHEPPEAILNIMRFLAAQEQESTQSTSETTTTSSNYSSSFHSTHKDKETRGMGAHAKGSTTTSRRPTSTTKKSITSTTKKSSSASTTTSKPSKSTTTSSKPSKSTTTSSKLSKSTTTTSKPSKSSTSTTTTTRRSYATGSPMRKSTSTTRKASTSTTKKASKDGAIGAAKLESSGLFGTMPGKVAMTGNSSTSITSNTSTTTTKDGKTTSNFTSGSLITTGDFLFEANIKILVTNETQRDEIMKMIENIPQSTGGQEMKLADQIMAHFGEKKIDKTKRKGSTRSFTYMKARNNVKGILGHLMERFKRKHCSCPACQMVKNCRECKKTECPVRKPNHNCPPCPVNIGCPAPKNCTSYPPCKPCQTEDDPDYDGDKKGLDDVDSENVLQEKELEKDITCKDGVTCDYEKTCGRAPINPLTPKKKDEPYMNGGENEIYGEWPAFVSIKINLPGQGQGMCGGVLVSNRHIITAAHCAHKPTENGTVGPRLKADAFTVILGEHDKNKIDEHEEAHKVTEVCAAKKFLFDADHGSRYDFALLTLDKNVTFNDYIQPVCLPYKALDLKKKPKCWVVGMGATRMRNGPEFSPVVQKMRVERASCKGWGIKHDDRSRHCFTKALSKGDTCGGDSGGPIMCLSHGHWTLAGLVSYGSEFCDGSESIGWVAVYTRIQALLKTMNAECKV